MTEPVLPPVTLLPVIDAGREGGDPLLISSRRVLRFVGYVEPLDELADTFIALPVRLCRTSGAGLCVEAGPYTLGRNDIEVLRAVIAAYDKVVDQGG